MKKQNLNNDLERNIFVQRADGEKESGMPAAGAAEVANAAQVLGDIIAGPSRRRAGLRVNGVFVSLESILLAGVLIVGIIALVRK